jgi:hypothetical protein
LREAQDSGQQRVIAGARFGLGNVGSHDRHRNVTIFLRRRHLFVTPGCNGAPKHQSKS